MKYSHLQNAVLVVDDEADIRDLMEMTLMKMGLQVETAVGVSDAKARLANKKYALVLTDMRMPDGSGLEVVQYLNALNNDTPIAVITAYGNAEQAQQALSSGAFDYLQKPITLAQLRTLIKSALHISEQAKTDAVPPAVKQQTEVAITQTVQTAQTASASTVTTLKNNTTSNSDVPRLLGQSPQIDEARQMIRRLAKSAVTVYISGESGSGKEQAARSIHELSPRAGKPFVAVNCGAIAENLMESEFFGYRKGSFTGALADKDGFFQAANGGTLFLDEVADLPLAMQVKLLRVLQEKAVRKIGDTQETAVDVRLICATHKDLASLVAQGTFREDLFYRLNVVRLNMPSLREIRADLPELIAYLLNRFGGDFFQLSPAAQSELLSYSYPGNFRELENILERAIALSDGMIEPEHLQLSASKVAQEQASQMHVAWSNDERLALPDFVFGQDNLEEFCKRMEQEIIEQALAHSEHNRTRAASLLGITFRSLRYRLDRLES
ncbi:MAG: sigma-54 dependent transcriptional regulator [Neisseria sp.]|nr:sigma-54 dependent transcriptional regulator [Neisseria sp.]